MTEKEYRAAEGINKSTLWEIRRSPAHYKYLLEHPLEDTPSLRFGRALHAALLTPTAYKREYVTAPDFDKRTKAGKEAYAEWAAAISSGATIMTADETQDIAGMLKSYKGCPDARNLLKKTRRELPIFWNDKNLGLKCKCRVDAMSASAVIDIKTTADGSLDSFRRDALKYGYHVQAAHYLDGVEALTGKRPDWYFIAIEKKPPYAVHVLKASASFIDFGEYERNVLMERLHSCMESGEWCSYQLDEIDVPEYMWGEAL